MMEKLPKISQKEKEVMMVLWRESQGLTASGIGEKGDGLNLNTIQVALRSLLKKGYIKIAEIVYSGTVLTRCYKYAISAEEYAAYQFQLLQMSVSNFSALKFIDYLRKNNATEILEELERIILERKK